MRPRSRWLQRVVWEKARCAGVPVGPCRTGRTLHRVAVDGAAPRVTRRTAFTLVEIMIAMTLLTILGAATLSFFIKQTRAVTMTAGRLDAQQNVSFALDEIDHDLRVAGVGLGLRQPMVIEAHPYAVTFNADLVTRDTASVTAASYFDPNVPDSLALALTPANRLAYPYSVIQYPDSLYVQASGLLSNAETISYWVTLDSTTARPDDYLLVRRVNNAPATVVARGLVFPTGGPAFRYFIPGTAINSRLEVTAPTLPLYFKEGTVGPDTMLAKLSEVRVQLAAVFKDPLGQDIYRSVNEYIPLLNAGLLHASACGAAPQAPTSITPTAWPAGDSIDVAWPASGDETGGERDVKSYSVYRRVGSSGNWGTPIYTVPGAGTVTYDFEDKTVPLGPAYQYAVVARDCTPALSVLTVAGTTVAANP
jgi:prepilin-type N-terminal cleavage/methylation domain-containing protein